MDYIILGIEMFLLSTVPREWAFHFEKNACICGWHYSVARWKAAMDGSKKGQYILYNKGFAGRSIYGGKRQK